MTWIVIVSIVLASLIKILMTCLPTPVVKWLLGKFETHQKIDFSTVTITYQEKELDKFQKQQIITFFNEAIFVKTHYIHPGSEHYFLSPKDNSIPYVLHVKERELNYTLWIRLYKDHVDVVKKPNKKKKIIAYQLFSDDLQNLIQTHE